MERKQLILVWSDGDVVFVAYESPSVMCALITAHRAEDEMCLDDANREAPVGICEYLVKNDVREIPFSEVSV